MAQTSIPFRTVEGMNNNDIDEKYIFGFALIPEIGPARFEKLKKTFNSLESAWKASATSLARAGIDKKTSKIIVQKRSAIIIEQEYEKFKQSKIIMLCKDQGGYPKRLKEIKSAPFVLFCLGNIKLLQKKQLAIVGTRKPTNYGQIVTEKLAIGISNTGLVVTSGMAHGIDSCAHKAALDAGKPTIAVLGGGIANTILQISSKQIAQAILSQDGLIVSEYQPNFLASKFTFPARNRIISGLSLGVLVIEAGEKSGSLITARYALEQNREVLAVPGNIFSPQSLGTNWLLKQGAQLVRDANDILEAFHFTIPQENNVKERVFDDEQEQKIYCRLSFEPIHIDKLARICNLNSSTVAMKLSLVELKGAIKSLGGGMFIRQ